MPSVRAGGLRGLALNVLLSIAVTLGLAGSLEAIARWREQKKPPPAVEDYLWVWDQKWQGDFYTIRSEVNGWPPWEEFNRDGMRDRTHPGTRPARVKRVVFLGDSVTLGDHIHPAEAYPQVLQARLDAEGRPVEVFSIALWGWSTRQERRAWEGIARKYAPDEVVLAVCLNDIPELQNNLSRPPRWLSTLHERSALVRAVVNAPGREIQRVEQLFSENDADKVRDAWERFFEEVRALRDSVRTSGARLRVAVFPFRFQVLPGAPAPVAQQQIAAFCRAEGLDCLDLLPTLRPLGADGFVDYDHLSPRGSAAVADLLATGALVPWPRRYVEVLVAAKAGNARDVPAALRHSSAEVRAAAAWALGRERRRASEADLAAALDDEDSAVRREAAAALGALGPVGEPAREALYRTAVDDADETVRWSAVDALFALGVHEADVPRLEGLLQHRDPFVRGFGAFGLGSLGPGAASAVPALAAALRFDDAYTRGGAASALAKMGPAAAEAVPALIRDLQDPDGDRRWKAARTLGRIGPPARSAVSVLASALADPNEYVRMHSARALGRIAPGAPDTREALRRAAADPEDAVRMEARAALEQTAPPAER